MLAITLTPDIVEQMTRALGAAGVRECGGVLMAEHIGHNHFAVRRITVQRTGSISRFIRDVRDAISGLRQFFKSTDKNYTRFNYLGEWHSHPLFRAEPSLTDHDSMRRIITDPDVGANFVVLLVVKLDESGALTGSAHTYLPDGAIHRSELLMEKE
jgi:integrative and conjugative element protein (TIGR02256 family)